MTEYSAGRLIATHYERAGDDITVVTQHHLNGDQREIVGEIRLLGDEIEDLIYILGRVQKQRKPHD